ncbi:MAG: hypothetical protein R3E60_04145 [Alphaproteobacteria bacterium]
MSTAQTNLPVALRLYDAAGHEVLEHRMGCLPRHHDSAAEVGALLNGHAKLAGGFGSYGAHV